MAKGQKIGALSAEIAADLHSLARIRNRFAHNIMAKFDEEPIIDALLKLNIAGKEVDPRRNPRFFYQDACDLLAFVLLAEVQRLDDEARARDAQAQMLRN